MIEPNIKRGNPGNITKKKKSVWDIVVAFGMVGCFFIAKDTLLPLGRNICRSISIPTDICYSFRRPKRRRVTFLVQPTVAWKSDDKTQASEKNKTQYLETRSAASFTVSLFTADSAKPFPETTEISTHTRFVKASSKALPRTTYTHSVTLSLEIEDISLPEAYQIRKLRDRRGLDTTIRKWQRNLAINDQHFEERIACGCTSVDNVVSLNDCEKKNTQRRVLVLVCLFCPTVVNWKND